MNKRPVYIFDFDSTLIQLESLEELAYIALANHPERSARMASLEHITKQGMAGEMPFDESINKRLKLFQAHKSDVDKLINHLNTSWTTSVLEHEQWFKDNKDDIYVVSGGFSDYIVPLANKIGISKNHVFANRFTYDNDSTITGLDTSSPLSQPQGKVKQVQRLKFQRPVIMVGDGYTDYEVRKHGHADEFWAFTENISRPQVTEVADRIE